MQRRVCFALLALFLVPAAYADSLQDALEQRYKNQVLALRHPFVHGDQNFDSTGQPLNSPSGSWLVYGAIFVRGVKLSADTLELDGPRVAPKKANGNEPPVAVALGKDIRVEIHLKSAVNSVDEARDLLNRIFFLDEDASIHGKPEYRRSGDEVDGPVYNVRNDHTTPPKAIYTPEPEFTEEARKAGFQGMVILGVLIDKNGRVDRITIEKSLGMGLDEQAVETVKTWRFHPSTKDGEPVAVQMNIEVSFNLYLRR